MVPGTSVQIYAEDRIASMLQHKFDILFSEKFWPQHLVWRESTLDGTLGVVTDDLSDTLVDFDDICVIFKSGRNTPIPLLPVRVINPYLLTGTSPRFFAAIADGESNDSKVFQIWPKASTGDLQWAFRKHPKADTPGRLFVPADTVPFDDHALILGAVFDALEDDGTNPNATQKFQSMFEARLKQLKRNINSVPIPLDQGASGIPTDWQPL